MRNRSRIVGFWSVLIVPVGVGNTPSASSTKKRELLLAWAKVSVVVC